MGADKKEHVKNLIASLRTLETQMEPYKEQKRELRKTYVENGWLTRDDVSSAIKAYRMIEKGQSFESLEEMFALLQNLLGVGTYD